VAPIKNNKIFNTKVTMNV